MMCKGRWIVALAFLSAAALLTGSPPSFGGPVDFPLTESADVVDDARLVSPAQGFALPAIDEPQANESPIASVTMDLSAQDQWTGSWSGAAPGWEDLGATLSGLDAWPAFLEENPAAPGRDTLAALAGGATTSQPGAAAAIPLPPGLPAALVTLCIMAMGWGWVRRAIRRA